MSTSGSGGAGKGGPGGGMTGLGRGGDVGSRSSRDVGGGGGRPETPKFDVVKTMSKEIHQANRNGVKIT